MSDGDCNIKVICRFRPINNREKQEAIAAKEDPDKTMVKFIDDCTCEIVQNIQGNQKFVFDRVFRMDCKQPDVYDSTARKTIEDVINGFNGTIFAYGQTGAGKSFSMFGGDDPANEVTRGLIPRASTHIFNHIVADKTETEYTIKVSFLEIYNEKIRDLLDTTKDNLQVRQSPARGIYVDGATEEFVNNEASIYALLDRGNANRTVQSTLMNAVSSRSHSVFIVIVQQKDPEGSTKNGKLNLVDLAGSEKISKTGVQGSALEEAKSINKSLSALGNCIHALTEKSATHIPYRDSKLTRMLQESLGGNCKTTLLIACSPHPFNVDETISTCKFGQRAKSIKNRVKQNAQKSVAELMAIIAKLQQQLAMWKAYSEKLEKALAWYKENNNGELCPINVPSKPTLAALMNSGGSGGSAGSGDESRGGSRSASRANKSKGGAGSKAGSRAGSRTGSASTSREASSNDDGLEPKQGSNQGGGASNNNNPKPGGTIQPTDGKGGSAPGQANKGKTKSSDSGSLNKVPSKAKKSSSSKTNAHGSGTSDNYHSDENIGFRFDDSLDDPLVMLTTLKAQLERTEKAKDMMKESYEDEIEDMKQTIREQYGDIKGLKEKLHEYGVDTSMFGSKTINGSWLENDDDEITRAIRNSVSRGDASPPGYSISNPQWEEEKNQLEEELVAIGQELDETKAVNTELEAKVKELEAVKRENMSFEQRILEMEEIVTAEAEEKETLEKEFEEMKAESAAVQEELNEQIEAVTAENNEMQQMVVTLDDELEQTKTELEEQVKSLESKTAELNEYKELSSTLEQQVAQYEADLEELQNNLEIMKRSRDEALKDKGELRETTQKVDQFKTELSHERTRADQMTIRCSSLEKTVEVMKAEISTLKATQEQQRKESREKDLEIKRQIQVAESEQLKNEMLQTKLDAANTNVASVKEELAIKTSSEKELKFKFEKLTSEVKNLTDATQKVAVLEEQLDAAESERKKLAETAKKATSEVEARTREIVFLKTKQSSGSERIHALNTQIKTLKCDVCKCNEKILNYERQISLMQGMFEEEKKEIIAKYTRSGARITYGITPSILRNSLGVNLTE